MGKHLLHTFMCRFFGKSCALCTPTTHHVLSQIRDRSKAVDAQTVEIRRKRRSIEEGWRRRVRYE